MREKLVLTLVALVLAFAPPARTEETPASAWQSRPQALLSAWRIAPLSKQPIEAGATRWLSDKVPANNRPEEMEALLPGSKPQVARFPAMFLKQGEWSTLSFTGSSDTFAGLIDETTVVPRLRLHVNIDGKELPEVQIPLQPDLSGTGIVLAGAPDGTSYAVGASVILIAKRP